MPSALLRRPPGRVSPRSRAPARDARAARAARVRGAELCRGAPRGVTSRAGGSDKKHNKHLPRGVTHEHGAYYFRGPDRKRVRLRSALGESLAAWAALVQPEPGSIATLHYTFERRKVEVIPKKAPKTQQGYLYMLPGLDLVWGRVAVSALKPRHGYRLLDEGAKTPTQALNASTCYPGS
jgi:hypothetical protein